jgi:lysophospholipase L1-like esterase
MCKSSLSIALVVSLSSLMFALADEPIVKPKDPSFEKFQPSPLPTAVAFEFRKGDRLAICGDSITEAAMYSRMIEMYLTVCQPESDVAVRTHGKGGETVPKFRSRIAGEVLRFKPTVVSLCYGMNDHGYRPETKSGGIANYYQDNLTSAVKSFTDAKIRVVLASPGCVGKLPPWDFVKEEAKTDEPLNLNLCGLRNRTIEIAKEKKFPYADTFWNMLVARHEARKRFGAKYELCGSDGVHPDWAGHVVMAYGFFKAFGFDGDLGTIEVDLTAKSAKADKGHQVKEFTTDTVSITSSRYPFCGDGDLDSDKSVRSGMSLVPFNRDFNRLTLKVTGTTAKEYTITWGKTSRVYTAEVLAKGINLADDFVINPFSEPFKKVNEAVLAKQKHEAEQTWKVLPIFPGNEKRKDYEELIERSEVERAKLVKAIQVAYVPVTHSIRITPK